MLTLYYAPMTRASRILQLLHELDAVADVTLSAVDIPRRDGSGQRDPSNPHPEGKVPYLVDDGAGISESNAIALYLTDLYPESGLGYPVGDPRRGAYLAWLAYYGNVVEPVYVLQFSGIENPMIHSAFRSVHEVTARLENALKDRPYLMGDRFTAADLLLCSLYLWMPDATPDIQCIKDWVARCAERPSLGKVQEFDTSNSQT